MFILYFFVIKYNGDRMYTIKEINQIINDLNIKFDKFTKDEFIKGLEIELELGTINKNTNVTNDNILLTAKIALAHLNEFPNYYNEISGLSAFEKNLKNELNNL